MTQPSLQGPASKALLTPEFRLLLECSVLPSASQQPSYAARIAQLCSGSGGAFDWDAFTGLVDRHRVPALVCAALSRYAREHVPEKIGTRLKARDRSSRINALKLSAELARLGRLFTSSGIEVIPYKGPILSMDLYGDPTLRQLRDLDLMVKPQDLDRADEIMLEEKYKRTIPDFDLSERQKKAFLSAGHHYEYIHPERSGRVELHWRIDLWTPEQIGELWKHTLPMEWRGVSFRRLTEEMSLLLLCDHGSFHQWSRIKWLSDLAAIFSACSRMNWAYTIEAAERLDLQRSLATAALLVSWLYRLPLEAPLAGLIEREKKAAALAHESLRVMAMSEKEINEPSFYNQLKHEAYIFRMRARLPCRRLLERKIDDTEAWKLVPIPDRMFRLYYLLRLPLWLGRCLMK